MSLEDLEQTCRSFFDEGIRSAAALVRDQAEQGREITLEELAVLIEATATGNTTSNPSDSNA